MHDSVATFYGGYDQAGVGKLPLLRFKWIYLAVGVAAVALLVLVAADVSAAGTPGATVEVTSVQWYLGASPLASAEGFVVHANQHFTETLTCQLICYNFVGAEVSSPFHLLAASFVNDPIQYANLTLAAPASAYAGPLVITMVTGPSSSVDPAIR